MDYTKLFQIITMELTSDILKAEQELESIINKNDFNINEKVIEIKDLLRELTILESSLEKFTNMLNQNNNNDNNNNN